MTYFLQVVGFDRLCDEPALSLHVFAVCLDAEFSFSLGSGNVAIDLVDESE